MRFLFGRPLGRRESLEALVRNRVAALDIKTESDGGKQGLCAHEGGDNCADHGPGIADLAQATVPDVYGDGVWGHDHIMDGPGGPDFNVGWQVVVVLFTNADAAKTHVTTTAQLDAAIDAGDAFSIVTPTIIHGNLVAGSTYNRATPLPPAR